MTFDYPFSDCAPVLVAVVEPSDRMTVDFDINEVDIEPLIP